MRSSKLSHEGERELSFPRLTIPLLPVVHDASVVCPRRVAYAGSTQTSSPSSSPNDPSTSPPTPLQPRPCSTRKRPSSKRSFRPSPARSTDQLSLTARSRAPSGSNMSCRSLERRTMGWRSFLYLQRRRQCGRGRGRGRRQLGGG